MTLSQDLGIEELKAACEDYVVSTLSVTNACTYLAAVMEIQDKSTSKLKIIYLIPSFHRTFVWVWNESVASRHIQMFVGSSILSWFWYFCYRPWDGSNETRIVQAIMNHKFIFIHNSMIQP